MAWGSFVKKLKDVGQKALGTVKKVSEYAQKNIIPTARKINEATKTFNPYYGAIDSALDWADTATKKGQKVESWGDAYEQSGLDEWVGKKLQYK